MINTSQIVYNSRIYQHDNIYNNLLTPNTYLTRYINILLRSIVNSDTRYSNKVIGCDPFFVDIVNNNIKFVISAGRIIIDSTLIEIKTPIFLDYPLNPLYTSIVILAGYTYLANNNKASFQICLLDETTNQLHTNGPNLIDMGLTCVVLGKFRIKYSGANVAKIYQPYGIFRNRHYSQFLINSVSPVATAVNNKIFTLLYPAADLYNEFSITTTSKTELYTMSLPVYLELYWSGIKQLYNTKMRSRYMIPSIENYYFNPFDYSIQHKTEAFNDEYSYSI